MPDVCDELRTESLLTGHVLCESVEGSTRKGPKPSKCVHFCDQSRFNVVVSNHLVYPLRYFR
jgi:hypothetical protein